MKMTISIATLLTALALFAADPASNPQPAAYIDHDKVAEAFAKGGALAKGDDFTASVLKRTAAGQVEIHIKETDIFYITAGEATFVTGGKIIGAKETRPNQLLGTDIEGGVTHTLTKGDIITIPAGTPHWFKEIKSPIFYYMVKVIRP
jgi:mannose-6-phosphate isomerase-like protein (cupin superfamily)